MSDVKVERKDSVASTEAAAWLAVLSKAFSEGGHVELPFGAATVSMRIPDQVQAEFEVEVSGDKVEVEVEFKWSIAQREAGPPADSHRAAPRADRRKAS